MCKGDGCGQAEESGEICDRGVVQQVSNFDDLTKVVMDVKLKSKALFIGPYSNSQQRLFDRVYLLREREQLTFEAIAVLLTKSGTRSVNGCLLGAEHVFSIYKKGKLRQERLTLEVKPELLDMRFE
jgi:hypothetical protein